MGSGGYGNTRFSYRGTSDSQQMQRLKELRQPPDSHPERYTYMHQEPEHYRKRDGHFRTGKATVWVAARLAGSGKRTHDYRFRFRMKRETS